jgi:hypothetical protein
LAHIGENKTGPGNRERAMTLVGKVRGNNLNEVQTKVAALEAAFALDRQLLYWHDGATLRINNVESYPLTVEFSPEWGQYEAHYNITLFYYPLDDGNTAPFLVKYRGFTFDPIPIFGREFNVERESPDSARQSDRVNVSLSGFFEEGSLSGNLTELNALIAELALDGQLDYGAFSQTVKVNRFSHAPDVMDRRVSYAINFSYEQNLSGGGTVKKMSSQRRITRRNQRSAFHFVPFLDHASGQLLGETGQTITATGFVVATSMADARAAALTEINAQFPGGGVELTSSEITEKYNENRVEWSVSRFYTAPVLTGGVYN